MRKGLFAVVLVAASFAGGAAVNDLGRGWLRSLIGGQVPRESVAVALAVDGDEPATPKAKDDAPGGGIAPVGEIPAADPPALIPAPPPRPDPSVPAPREAPGPGPVGAGAKPEAQPPGALDPEALRVEAPRDEGPPPLPAPRTIPAPPPPMGPPVAAPGPGPDWADAPGSAPATAVLPRSAGGPAPLDPVLAPATTASSPPVSEGDGGRPAGDWAALRRRMRELGVGRYWSEGRPDGPARFHCLIPLAGAAVGQHFEAEGDDDLQAAEAALRRVALWRATETP